MDEYLSRLYYDPKRGESFRSVAGLYRAAKEDGQFPGVTLKKVKDFLSAQDTYTLHRKRFKTFPRNKVIVGGIDEEWMLDTAVFAEHISEQNDNYPYIVVAVDCFSRYAWAEPIRDKSASSVVEALKRMFSSGRKCGVIFTDMGTEYKNQTVSEFLKSQDVDHWIAHNHDTKASIAENFIKNLKARMWRYFEAADTMRFIDILPDLIKSYNHSYHRVIKTKPYLVTDDNEREIWYRLYGDKEKSEIPKPKSVKFKVGDHVRLSVSKLTFEKGYTANFTREVFKAVQVIKRDPPVYKVNDLNNSPITGVFYAQEMQYVKYDPNAKFKIEAIIKRRTKNGRREGLVKWLGWNNSFNTWLPLSEIDDIS